MAGYEVTYAALATRQAATIPPAAQEALDEVLGRVADNPDLGRRFSDDYPPYMRMTEFGEWGVVVYVVLERSRQVAVLDINWAG